MDILKYLAQATPEEWHQVAMLYNWDDGVDPLWWIARQPTCDGGTALLVYWRASPRYFAQYAMRDEVPELERHLYDLVMAIERAYVTSFYVRREIAFDPRDDRGIDWTVRHAAVHARRQIPADMYLASPGRKLEWRNDFVDGYPPGVEA